MNREELAVGKVPRGDAGLICHWGFDAGGAGPSLDQVTGKVDKLRGHLQVVGGVGASAPNSYRGSHEKRFALRFDGITTFIERPEGEELPLSDAFSVEAWVALGAYPWNCAPIIDTAQRRRGFLFAIDDRGSIVLGTGDGERWSEIRSREQLRLNEWHHVVATYSGAQGGDLFIDGVSVGHVDSKDATFKPAIKTSILIGRSREALAATGAVRPASHLPLENYLDGVLCGVKVFDIALTPDAIVGAAAEFVSRPVPQLPKRTLPMGPAGKGRFGAFYTKLSYYDAWDRQWRVGDHSDIVVRFDDEDYRFIFWRGTNYIPCWATGNGIWYTNEFNETWGHGATGCAEPMSDKNCLYSHVRIIESHEARVVVHWRYALVDVLGVLPRQDPVTKWTDWSDELYTIYPDGVGTRKVTLHSSQPLDPHEFQESIVVLSPGQRPEDVIDPEAVTMANMAGEEQTYSWVGGCPDVIDKPDGANIELINIKSATRPFLVVPDRPCLKRNLERSEHPVFPVYREEIRPPQLFPWWNHWPTAELRSDGRYAQAADRASSSSLLTGMEWEDFEVTPTSRTRVMLAGLTRHTASGLVPLAQSWLQPAPLTSETDGLVGEGYDVLQRAYVLRAAKGLSSIQCTIHSSPGSPLRNVALVIKNWTAGDRVALRVSSVDISRGADFRLALRQGLDGDDLIVWVRCESETATTFELSAIDDSISASPKDVSGRRKGSRSR